MIVFQFQDSLFWDVGAKGARPGGGHEGVPVRVYPEVVPVDPGQPRREVACVPVHGARRPQLASEALLDVGDGLEVTQEDLTQQRDVGDGQPQGVDLTQPLLIGKSRNVTSGKETKYHSLLLRYLDYIQLRLSSSIRTRTLKAKRKLK